MRNSLCASGNVLKRSEKANDPTTENRIFFAPDTEPSLDLAVPILHISGLDNYSPPRPRFVARSLVNENAVPNAGSGPSGTYMGNDFRAAYVPDSTLDGSGQVVGLLQFDGYTASDIAYYENKAGLQTVTLQNVLLDGFSGNPTGSGGEVEVSLDIEMAISMATNLSKVIVYEAGPFGDWHDILNRMATDNLARQLSCSWYIPGGGADAVADGIWQEMAAQGQSFFNASGDDDAWAGLISFPGDTPYITQVGGTTLTTSGPDGSWVSETVWNFGNGIGSGGGISTQYPIPSWQTNISMTANQGSTTERNTPDVAFTANNVYVRADGHDYNVAGTSCAAPLWAGFAALINQQAAATGKPAVGFINPALDAIATGANYNSAFHDITTGNNESPGSPAKFSAVVGYDLCTGWGTPAGQNLINALANPEALLITPPAGFISSGGFGGPFTVTSQNFSLTNVATNSLTWTLTNTSTWLTVSSFGGTLTPGGLAATVTASLNSAASNLVVGIYNATLWFTNLNDNMGQSRQFILNVISPPTITTQPANQAVLEGATAEFTISATGGLPLSYHWQDNGTNLTDGVNVSGSATTNLIISGVTAANVGTYSVVVTNLAGTTISSNALLTITPSAPVIIMQPSNQTAIVGQTAVFTVAAIGTTPFSYQWIFNTTNIVGATNAMLALTNVQLSQTGNYAVTVTNIYGSTNSSNATLNVYSVPVITSFTPQSGTIGTVVNIGGLNFDPTAANNTVYFGAVEAAVSAASVTNLTVTVPVGATFGPVTETVNGLTAYADQMFTPTFAGSGQITNSSLASRLDLPTGSGPIRVVIADMDGDGKPDLVIGDAYAGEISIYRNISTNGSLTAGSFAARVDLPVLSSSGTTPYWIATADLDGDGKLDIIALSSDHNVVSIFRNNSSPGSITTNSFAARMDLPAGNTLRELAVQDLNGDGRPEIVTANYGDNGISIYQNMSTVGNISFAPRVNFVTGNGAQGVVIGDFDGDGMPDLAVVNTASDTVSILRNLGAAGSGITTNSFAPGVNFSVPPSTIPMVVGDLDGDGRLDLVVGSESLSQTISVFRNTATAGSFSTNSFAPRVDFATAGWVNSLALADVDGDGKLDIALVWQQPSGFSIFKNVSTPGSFTTASLAARVDYSAGTNPYGVSVGDLDGDGRPDVVFANVSDNTLSIYRNIVPFTAPPAITLQPTNLTVIAGGNATFSAAASGSAPLIYQWKFNSTNIVGATNALLTLTNVQFSQAGNYALQVTNVAGAAFSSNAVLTIVPDHFSWGQIPSPRFVNTPFSIIIQARDMTNGTFTNFTGAVFLTSTNGVPINPAVSGNFVQGAWTGSVMVAQTATNLVLQASDSFGQSGLANPINIVNLPSLTTVPSGSTLYVFWPVSPSGFVLETTTNLSPANWVPSAPPIQIGNQFLDPIQMSGTNAFFRLRFSGP